MKTLIKIIMRYGLPYKGSKNRIIEKIIPLFPERKNFYDLFCGGCSVTHGAILSGKFENFVINDLDGQMPELFFNAIHGKYNNETRWISREDFLELKDSDSYVRICWSFGNNGREYLYSKEVEPWKKALHYARVLKDFSLLRQFGIETDNADRITIKKNKKEYIEKYILWALNHFDFTDEEIAKYNQYKKEGVFENLIPGSVGLVQLKKRLRSLQSLESLERLQSLSKSYDEIEIKENSLIYCDIPYRNTDGYTANDSGFDYKKFYKWAQSQKELVIISEYSMPDDFKCVAEFYKRSTFSMAKKVDTIERLFIPKNQLDLWLPLQIETKKKEWRQLEFDFAFD